MYGAKAEAIGKAAWETWGNKDEMPDAIRTAVREGVFLVQDETKTAADLQGIKGFPKALGHEQFVRLARSLANNPLVA